MNKVNTTGVDGLEALEKFLNQFEEVTLEPVEEIDGEFNRVRFFTVNDFEYKIVWFKNQSTLYMGDKNRSAQIPFTHVFFNDTLPLVGGNRNLAFTYSSEDSPKLPYESFRIPL